jgi:hypothetical protein
MKSPELSIAEAAWVEPLLSEVHGVCHEPSPKASTIFVLGKDLRSESHQQPTLFRLVTIDTIGKCG